MSIVEIKTEEQTFGKKTGDFPKRVETGMVKYNAGQKYGPEVPGDPEANIVETPFIQCTILATFPAEAWDSLKSLLNNFHDALTELQRRLD